MRKESREVEGEKPTATAIWGIRFISLVICLLLAFIIPGGKQLLPGAQIPTALVRVNVGNPMMTSKLETGATHTDHDVDQGEGLRVTSAKQTMQSTLVYQNQHIMGWGAGNPEPKPGEYDWKDLDERVQLMRSTHAKIVLTLCCAPGWMHPIGYQDDWNNLEVAPDNAHVQDFAELTRQVALRYPDVKSFLVWNELKGMWTDSPGSDSRRIVQNRWDYERYTTLYNAVYDAVKSVRPDAQIGGPYIDVLSYGLKFGLSNPGPEYSWGILDQRSLDVISYWLSHKHGADFIAVDGTTANADGVWLTDDFGAGQKFTDVDNWIRSQKGGETLPIWWAEWYAGSKVQTNHALNYYNALMASDTILTLESRATVVLLWGPQGDASGYSFPEGLWTDVTDHEGGRPTLYSTTLQVLKDNFGSGARLCQTTVSSTSVSAIATTTRIMLVSRLATQQTVYVNNRAYLLDPYEVLLANLQ